MNLDALAKRLSDRGRIGLVPELADKLKIKSEDATRGQLMGQIEDDRAHLGVYLLGVYVVEDTDFWGDGEIYWWSIPVLVDKAGKAAWDTLSGLPMGAAPHKVGSLEWMTNFTLQDPPLLAVIPPSEDISACVIRIGLYDDDGAAADIPRALTAGLEVLSGISRDPLSGPEQIITPVRDAIWKSLRAEQDDILIDQDVTLRRGETSRFNTGLIGSEMNAMARLYYLVRDEQRTEQIGPLTLHKGQMETIKFKQPMRGGGRLAMFARGADVHSGAFGELNTDMPFINRIIEGRGEEGLANGFNITGTGPAKFVAFYTPP